jgi:hypothetical protein
MLAFNVPPICRCAIYLDHVLCSVSMTNRIDNRFQELSWKSFDILFYFDYYRCGASLQSSKDRSDRKHVRQTLLRHPSSHPRYRGCHGNVCRHHIHSRLLRNPIFYS